MAKVAIGFFWTVCCVVSSVSAHGYLAALTINGKTYSGNVPGAQATPSVIRQVSDISPVKGTSNPDLNCGLSAQLAADVATANPGDSLAFDWRGGDNQVCPMLTYMTSCGSTPCSQYNSSQSKWFKIAQVGQVSSGVWAQQAVMEAVSVGGAEFYPACSQLQVGGSQTGGPTEDELCLLPGAYSDTDPGIYDPDIYDPGAAPYIFPGPPVAAFAGGDAAGTSHVPAAGSGGSDSTSSSSSSSSSSSKSVCKLQKQTTLATDTSSFYRNHRRRRLFTSLFRDVTLLYRRSSA
ncbi:glycosyl hydrolase family 61-domain-containing protein [Rhodocollybia butyracea]|uniref:lytic cellulose monooxygenase (C4-dehydrogenating) n=1 Tax=Rhodocollybia butyracea TaxID=206335 RepID=A0A9P5PZ96_9AGAR|nr:glycosyl hydrolase family 61-domain-containing protein [Rhodocollybia butyracea]